MAGRKEGRKKEWKEGRKERKKEEGRKKKRRKETEEKKRREEWMHIGQPWLTREMPPRLSETRTVWSLRAPVLQSAGNRFGASLWCQHEPEIRLHSLQETNYWELAVHQGFYTSRAVPIFVGRPLWSSRNSDMRTWDLRKLYKSLPGPGLSQAVRICEYILFE